MHKGTQAGIEGRLRRLLARPCALLCRFGRRQDGASAVEFALIAVPFFGLLFMIFQVSLIFLMQQGLKAAVDNAARSVLTGSAQNNAAIASWQNFRDTLICPSGSGNLLPSFITCPKVVVDVRPYSSFTGLTAGNVSQSFIWDGSGPLYQPGNPCDIVVVRAVYPMPIFLPMLMDATLGSTILTQTAGTPGFVMYGGQLVRMLTAAAVFRNEPYATSSNPTPTGGCS